MLDTLLGKIRSFIPIKLFQSLQPAYHFSLSFVAALIYRFPSRKINIIGVTGTKGKSSTVEILNAILEEAGYKTALSNTIRFKIGTASSDNLYKMSMPGRFFLQHLIRQAVDAQCDYLILEMTSQGALLHRHRFINLNTLIFTNLSPEHIEAHGSYENYRDAKLSICRTLASSSKKQTSIIANSDDPESSHFLACEAHAKITFGLTDVEPYTIKKNGIDFTWAGRTATSPLSGIFNLYNILAAITVARNENVSNEIIVRALTNFNGIPGRVEKIDAGQSFTVVVDYAHTVDSLEKLYQVFQSSKNICVLGGTGGGRDAWKRAEMGRIADTHCSEIILTNEDPYDEDPLKIVDDVASGITRQTPSIIMDRREAIREAVRRAETGDTVLITGKGTDPYIMGPHGSKTEWSDAHVAREEIEKLLRK
jgi:UDP-N-acetylmuramoyl-L-alanyl-D-glutamate--2,6-diaminopimelate ligase